jgi:hypothetical protein
MQMMEAISSRTENNRLIHVDRNNMGDSTKNQQIKEGDMHNVPIGKKPFPDGEL